MSDFITLKSNGDFQRLYHHGKACIHPALVLYYKKNRAGICRIGITTSKKIGNAVTRNRARRVLREGFRAVLPRVQPGYDFVLVARSRTPYRKSTQLCEVMTAMLEKERLLKEPGEDA